MLRMYVVMLTYLTTSPSHHHTITPSHHHTTSPHHLTILTTSPSHHINYKTMLKGKKIVLGITGSIAAYKSCLLIREFVKQGAEVQVVITPAGKEFITPITLSALTHKPVVSEFFSQGVADNMLITTYLSMKAPVFIAPAMDLDMYAHPSTQQNMRTLASYGNRFIEPASGFLASGLEGKGRMEEPEVIARRVSEFFDQNDSNSPLKGKRVVITAGPTYEKIDPVRFIGNYSSGKMGFAIAEECRRRGADVTLVAGPVSLKCSDAINRVDVESCREMYDAATEAFKTADVAILAAAVADYRPAVQADQKIKRGEGDMQINLSPNPDIAATLGQMKTERQTIVAFALETNDEQANAERKLQKKNADFIVLNSLRNEGTCFRTDDNQIEIIGRDFRHAYPKKSKADTAVDIVNELELVVG